MDTPSHYAHPPFVYDDDDYWSTLALWLAPQVRRLVYGGHLSAWKGQEEDVIDDIVSESLKRIIIHLKKVRAGTGKPIASMHGFASRTAHNCFIDLLRKDKNKVQLSQLADGAEEIAVRDSQPSMEETTLEGLFNEQLLHVVAYEISRFPRKQREAILRDQARRVTSMPDPSLLLHAFNKAGIRLQDYHDCAPAGPAENSRNSSLLYHAYHRLSTLPTIREFL